MSKNSLQILLATLTGAPFEVSHRGTPPGDFLFFEHQGRAVEVSMDADNQFWMEFWEASPDEEAAPAREATTAGPDSAARLVSAWLAYEEQTI